MIYTTHFDGKVVNLIMGDFEEDFDIDRVTSIDYSNLYGEAVTVSALMNKIGILRARAQSLQSEKELEFNIYESRTIKGFRREAIENGGKFKVDGDFVKLTESAIKEAVYLDKAWQVNKKNAIKATETFQVLDSLYWSIQSKDKKLSVLMTGVTPKEFFDEIIEGSINGIFIKKRKSIVER